MAEARCDSKPPTPTLYCHTVPGVVAAVGPTAWLATYTLAPSGLTAALSGAGPVVIASAEDMTLAVPDVHGLRLDAHPTPSPNGHGPSVTIGISAVSQPDAREVVEEHGARVFLDRSRAVYLDDNVLDVDLDKPASWWLSGLETWTRPRGEG